MGNKRIVFKLFIDSEKEEAFLNKMNKKGWKLVSIQFAFFYTFERTEPNEYKTILCFAERLNHLLFIRKVTDSGCEVVHQTNEGEYLINKGKYIRFYINIPADAKNVGFLTDIQSRIESKENLNKIRKFDATFMLIAFIATLPMVSYAVISYIRAIYSPEGYFKIGPIMLMVYLIFAVCMMISGTMSAYLSWLYRRTKREIKELSPEKKK